MRSPYLMEAWQELRDGLRGSLVPLMFVGLVGYVLLTMVHADYLRQLGATDVPRNSPHFVYLMTSGQAFWLIFAWAWVYAQAVTRDRAATLHEIVLTAPLSLRGLLLVRFAGATVLACLLGASTAIAVLLVPVLGTAGLIPADAVGPVPIGATLHAFALFVFPSAVGLGALYLVAALKSRSLAGPFGAAAAVVLAWMAAMVVLQGGDISPGIATLIDVSGFAEAKLQTDHWTPLEKATAWLRMSPPLLLNRMLWTALPLLLLSWTLYRLRREDLVLERDVAARAARRSPAKPAVPGPAPPAVVMRPAWWRALLTEARWQFSVSAGSWAFRLILIVWIVTGVAGAYAHLTAHAEGPLVPRAQLLAPFLADLCYVFIVFLIAGFVGTMSRRDALTGFGEIVDATPAPLAVRVLGRAVAAVVLMVLFALVPTVSAWIVMALSAPAFDPWTPLAINALQVAPALCELGMLTFLIHAAVRSAGTAHALSMVVAFIAIVNHEIEVVPYPPAQIGIPAHVSLSELTGWGPWLGLVLASDALKLGVMLLALAVAWLTWRRGTDLRAADRWRAFIHRARGSAGVLAAIAIAIVTLSAWMLYERLVVRGEYASVADRDAEDGAWEARWWGQAAPYSVQGGQVIAQLDPSRKEARIRWRLEGVRSEGGLHAEMPHGMSVEGATVDGAARAVVVAHDHMSIDLGPCAMEGCLVELDLRVDVDDWPIDAPPWLHSSGIWARAENLLPRLGYDPGRLLRAPRVRQVLHLPASAAAVAGGALAAELAVAPAGNWRWSVEVKGAGTAIAFSGATEGPLDFATVWLPQSPLRLEQAGLSIWHGWAHAGVAREVLEDVQAMGDCVAKLVEGVPKVQDVLQVPRDLGHMALHGGVLWIPESDGWDVGPHGVGRWMRRAAIAQTLAARALADAARLRTEPGARWLLDGVAGWAGLECVRRVDGADAWWTLMSRHSEHMVEAMGALSAPVTSLAADGAVPWVDAYAPQATFGWVQSIGEEQARKAISAIVQATRQGVPIVSAVREAVGDSTAAVLMGGPVASDLVVGARQNSQVEIRGQRWGWERGGWTSLATAPRVLLLPELPEQPGRDLGAAPVAASTDQSIVALDAYPAFERSPKDNRWRADP